LNASHGGLNDRRRCAKEFLQRHRFHSNFLPLE
jgi:hypothetical protein